MEAKVSIGHLEVHDEKGSYRIPIGRRSRKCLMILDQKEGEYIRSLELDLFTGFVYYCVDNATSGGLSYYYDMSSKKVSRLFVHRYLRLARNHGFVATPEEYEVFEKLPCENWVEEVEKLPGWKEAIENRMQRLLLPEADVVRIPASEYLCKSGSDSKNDSQPEAADCGISGIASVSFFRAPSAYPAREKEYTYLFRQSQGENLLLYRDDVVGNAFFGEDVEFERILSDTECAWLGSLILSAACPGQGNPGAEAAASATEQILTPEVMGTLFPLREELVLNRAVISYEDGTVKEITADMAEQIRHADLLHTALRGLLRREIELT
jgi:hypothetical protein